MHPISVRMTASSRVSGNLRRRLAGGIVAATNRLQLLGSAAGALIDPDGHSARGAADRPGRFVGQGDLAAVVPHDHHRVTDRLTAKEHEILRLLVTPLSRREISQHLFVSLNTVKTHQRALYRKLCVENRDAAVARARMLGLI